MSDATRFIMSTARIDDRNAMAAFLMPVPDNAALAALLGGNKPLNTRAYDDENQAARFVISDGILATCFTVTDITIDQAEMITMACEEADSWTESSFRAAVARVLGESP
jgi:hypothetical protein